MRRSTAGSTSLPAMDSLWWPCLPKHRLHSGLVACARLSRGGPGRSDLAGASCGLIFEKRTAAWTSEGVGHRLKALITSSR